MKIKICLYLVIVLLITSCDILRLSKFEVISWTPGEGYFSDPENIVVSLDFSNEPDKISVERNFSLTADGNRVRGIFFWNGKTMTFNPLTPLEKNNDYIINLSADAHDIKGLSMDETFYQEFTTRPGKERPILLSWYPQMYEKINDPRTQIILSFSIPVPLETLYDNVSFNPSMSGSWHLEDNGKKAIFTPVEPWTQLKQYEIRFSTSLTDNNRMNPGNDFISVFTTGTDHEKPFLVNARKISNNGSVIDLLPDNGFSGAALLPVENHEWEKDDRFLLTFSKPVNDLSVRNFLSAEGAPGLVMETSADFNKEFIFRFENIPEYESRFVFRIKPGIKDSAGNETKDEYIYRIFANGKYSKPPELAGLRMQMEPGNNTDPHYFFTCKDSLLEIIPIKEEYFPSGESRQTWIELYFNTAEGADINPLSLMELFRMETSNNVISFSPQKIECTNFFVSEPHPGWENFIRLEISGNITNSTNYGIIYFIVNSGLEDNFGNKNEKTQRIPVIK